MRTALSALAVVVAAAAISGCGATRGADRPAGGLPEGVAVHTFADDLAFGAHGNLVALEDGEIGTVVLSGRVTGKRALRPSNEFVGSGALSTDASRAAVFVQAGRSLVRAVGISDRALSWSANAGTSQYEEDRGYWSADGSRLLVETDGPLRLRDTRTGRLIRSFPRGSSYLGRQPLSPDGSALAMTADNGVAVFDVRTGRRRVIDLGAALQRPTWSADGQSIAGGAAGTFVVDVASGRARHLRADSGDELAWSPNGRWIAAYAVHRSDQDAGVSVIDVRTGQPTVIAKTGASEEQGRLTWSPDSRRVAYVSPPGIPCAPESGGGTC